ncbi:MAG: hypothetical protein HYX65_11240 [Gemmatimonadetes bacterium]|nr:hypothetical protein [Gemmatimonadota bacterium]
MLRTIFMVGIFALLGLFALKFVFGILGGLLGLFIGLLFLAAKIALVGGAVYLVVRVVSPSSAKRLREKFSGTSSM